MDLLAGCEEFNYPFYVNAAFVFCLNVVSTTTSQFVFQASESVTYATQIAGYFFSSICILIRWENMEKSGKNCLFRLFKYPSQEQGNVELSQAPQP